MQRINFASELKPKTAKQLAFYESQKVNPSAVFITRHANGTNRASKRNARPTGSLRFTARKFKRIILPRIIAKAKQF